MRNWHPNSAVRFHIETGIVSIDAERVMIGPLRRMRSASAESKVMIINTREDPIPARSNEPLVKMNTSDCVVDEQIEIYR